MCMEGVEAPARSWAQERSPVGQAGKGNWAGASRHSRARTTPRAGSRDTTNVSSRTGQWTSSIGVREIFFFSTIARIE